MSSDDVNESLSQLMASRPDRKDTVSLGEEVHGCATVCKIDILTTYFKAAFRQSRGSALDLRDDVLLHS